MSKKIWFAPEVNEISVKMTEYQNKVVPADKDSYTGATGIFGTLLDCSGSCVS
ncbi:MAG TPA: hypothetical protein VN611_06765 [Patescibacteria group bacterium]|nr:hypothetical protein [Patescibacteria group bacterium]